MNSKIKWNLLFAGLAMMVVLFLGVSQMDRDDSEKVATTVENQGSEQIADSEIDTADTTLESDSASGKDTLVDSEDENAEEEDIADSESDFTEDKESTETISNAESQSEEVEEETQEEMQEEAQTEKIEAFLNDMTLEEKVAQMFVITPEALTGYGTVTEAGETTKSALEEYPVGGIVYFAANIVSKEQVTEMITNQQEYAMESIGLPLFISVDEEGGQVARIANSSISVQTFPDLSEIGASEDLSQAYELGDVIGGYLKDLGFNLDYAPVADVLTNSENTVVKKRSFGADANLVSEMVLEELKGLEENQVYGCLKHFPGHGATSGDTHAGYAYTDKTLDEMMEDELIPFIQGIEAGVTFIMVSHIAAPNVTGDNAPATLSEVMVTEILREQLGFEGIVITDGMNMGAISNEYTSEEAAVKAVKAGVDMILMPADFKAAYSGVLDAVKSGEISEERIDESLRRIIGAKLAML